MRVILGLLNFALINFVSDHTPSRDQWWAVGGAQSQLAWASEANQVPGIQEQPLSKQIRLGFVASWVWGGVEKRMDLSILVREEQLQGSSTSVETYFLHPVSDPGRGKYSGHQVTGKLTSQGLREGLCLGPELPLLFSSGYCVL